jgi:hypothetical protein
MRDFQETIPVMPQRAPMPYRPRLVECSADACRQGREPCPTPAACELYADEGKRDDGGMFVVAWGAALLVAGCIALALWLAGG